MLELIKKPFGKLFSFASASGITWSTLIDSQLTNTTDVTDGGIWVDGGAIVGQDTEQAGDYYWSISAFGHVRKLALGNLTHFRISCKFNEGTALSDVQHHGWFIMKNVGGDIPFKIRHDGLGDKINIYIMTALPSTYTVYSSVASVPIGVVWNTVKFEMFKHATQGWFKLWINDVLDTYETGIDTSCHFDTTGHLTQLWLGNVGGTAPVFSMDNLLLEIANA